LEVADLIAGIALGGSFGIGTIAYAAGIGPLVHIFLPWFTRFADGGRPTAIAATPA
jgi:uncharacterized membrane protein YczE